MSPTGTHHHHTITIIKSLSTCGVDVVKLKRSIAIILLKPRARAYRAIYDAAKTPRSDVDHRLSPRLAPLLVLRLTLAPFPLHL